MATYEYIIRNESGGSGSGTPAVAKTSTNTNAENNKPQAETSKSISGAQKAGKIYQKAMSVYAVQQAVAIVKSEVNYKLNTVELRTGCKDLQQKVDAQMIGINAGLNVAGAALAGLAVGGLAGAAVGAGMSIFSQVISFTQSTSQAQRTIDLKQSIEDETIRLQMIRAGSRGSRGNYDV